MSDRDLAISPTTNLPKMGTQIKKPCYLVILESKSKDREKFIALDQVDSWNNFIKVKGVYSGATELEILKNYSSIINDLPKEEILDMMFPVDRIISIRSLTFNANKSINSMK